MRVIKKTIALFLLVAGALLTVSCDKNDDSPFVQTDGFKEISYGFVMYGSSISGLKVNITYIDQTNVNKGYEYKGNYDWTKSFSAPVAFIPAMSMQFQKDRQNFTENDFPAHLKCKAGIVSGGNWSPLEISVQFNTLAEFNAFFESGGNRYVLNPYGQNI